VSKTTGLGFTTLTVQKSDGSTAVDIRNDVQNLDWATPRAVIDVTGVDKFAHERLLGLADFTLNLSGTFNAASSHTVFSDVATTSVDREAVLEVAGASMTNTCVITDYPITRGTDGALTWKVPLSLADGTAPAWT
jgi:hypothetical protein